MIYLLRHAETEWNFQLRKQGLDDSPLTEKGCAQAEGYGRLLKKLLVADGIKPNEIQVHVSPLGRTRVTAGYLINRLGLSSDQVIVEPRLIEFDYGMWSGLTNDEIEQAWPGALDRREQDKWFYQVPGGQSYAEVERKVDGWLAELDAQKIIIAVTHSVVSRVIRGKYSSMDYQRASRLDHRQNRIFRLHNGQIERFDIEPEPAVSATSFAPRAGRGPAV